MSDANQNSIIGVQSMLQERNRFNVEDSRAFAHHTIRVQSVIMILSTGNEGVGTRTSTGVIWII